MNLEEALSYAEDKLRAVVREERSRLVSDIEAMRRQHAAKGLLQSGATLKRIRDLGIESLSRRVEQTFSTIRIAIEDVEPRVTDAKVLMPVILQFIPEDLDDQGQHLQKTVADLNVPNALPQLLEAIAAARANALQKAEAELQLFLNNRVRINKPARHEKIFGWLEVISVLVTFVLAILWIRNPGGPYEPYLVLVASIATALNLLYKSLRRNA